MPLCKKCSKAISETIYYKNNGICKNCLEKSKKEHA
jgi:hypothetical protein